MLLWLLKLSFISISLIIIIHYLYSFFKMTLTVPKVKDLVYRPSEKYETLLNSINNSPHTTLNNVARLDTRDSNIENNGLSSQKQQTPIVSNSNSSSTSMELELKQYLKSLKLKKISNKQSLSGELNLSSSNDMPNLMYSSY